MKTLEVTRNLPIESEVWESSTGRKVRILSVGTKSIAVLDLISDEVQHYSIDEFMGFKTERTTLECRHYPLFWQV